MKRNKLFSIGLALGIAVAGFILAGCTSVSNTAECILIVGNGGGEPHTVKNVIYPGESHGDEGDDWQKHIPCGQRNYQITPPGSDHGDRHFPVVGWTKPSEDGKTPRMQVKMWLTGNWELNQSRQVLDNFWVFCQKYTCASDGDIDNSKNYSSAGWNGMLSETWSPAVDAAGAAAIAEFGPDLWKNRELWPQLMEKVSVHMADALKAPLDNNPFYCGRGSMSKDKGECKPIKFTIEQPGVEPMDPQVMDIQNRIQAQNEEQSADQARIDRTNKLYGPYADYFRGVQDAIDRCNAKAGCQILIGSPIKAN